MYNINNSVGKTIIKGAVIITIIGIVAKFLSFILEALLAAYLGTTYQSDAYYMVANAHMVIDPMMITGIWTVFLPLYKSHVSKDQITDANTLANKCVSFFIIISACISSFLFFFSPLFVSIMAPGFEGETRKLCIRLMRISSPKYIFIITSAVYASMLQCHNKFLGSQIREVASHIPIIIALLFFYKQFGIEVLAIALVAAGILRLIIELPFVTWGYHYKPDFKFRTPEFSLMLERLPSALVSAGVVQLNALIDKAMASTLPAGTVSALNYGHKLMNVFSGLLSSAITTALYPQMVEMITLEKKKELSGLTVRIINIFCVMMVPVTLACVLFRSELVSVVFQRGAFDANSTALTANVFALYCLGIYFTACSSVISNIFYGSGDTRTPMKISIAALVINVSLNLILIRVWGVNGLALATSLSAVITFFVRLAASGRYIQLDGKAIALTCGKALIASIIACLVPRVLFRLYPINPFFVLLLSAMIGVPLYWFGVKLLKIPEIKDLSALVKKKLKKPRKVV